ncbi:MAG: hypothetical protein Q8P67_28935, partial [archaeon]|nr:hypothetical protein [archaeon]
MPQLDLHFGHSLLESLGRFHVDGQESMSSIVVLQQLPEMMLTKLLVIWLRIMMLLWMMIWMELMSLKKKKHCLNEFLEHQCLQCRHRVRQDEFLNEERELVDQGLSPVVETELAA